MTRARFAFLRNLACFLVGLIGVCGAIHATFPVREDVPVMSAKLRWLEAHGERYDTVFIGSSRVFHQVIPSVFDTRLAELGKQNRSFNLGADGMNFPEIFFAAEQTVRRIPQLRLLVLELGNIQRGLEDESVRALYWHTPELTWMTIRSIAGSDSDWSKKAHLISGHIGLFARNWANLGRGQQWPRIIHEKPAVVPVGEDGCDVVQRFMDAAQSAEFEKLKSKRAEEGATPVLNDPSLSAGLERFTAQMRAQGVKVVFVKMPAFRKTNPPTPNADMLDFDSPQNFPELWEANDRYDPHHLNLNGARIFTRLLAERISALVEDSKR